MTIIETPPPASPVNTKAEGVNLRPTMWIVAGALALSGLLLFVGPMIFRGSNVKIPAGATRVNVSLFEYGIGLDSSTVVPSGKVAFVITNRGRLSHELVGFATDATATRLPLKIDGDVNEESAQMTNMLDTGASLPPGTTKVVTVELQSGTHYALVCNLPGHWAHGMRIDITPK